MDITALRIDAVPIGTIDQMLILLQDAARLEPPRGMHCAEDGREKSLPPSSKMNEGDRHHAGHRQ
ncbi:hypothetical protein [Bradyrhizobium mercantei]|uniref:hypothetical protein n=1 Tax=Bradyrhizobium mercantei TaxID=1904807 RepID=UPI001177FD55|nr:hypothetical protein [Bradyrhizobium mercantei]